ncbi:MAG: hypothetical protein EP329_04250, partial [Deltaproteobacteria bacterium]
MNPHRTLRAATVVLVLLTAALTGCATRGPGRMRIAVVGEGLDEGERVERAVSELEERLVGALLAAPRVEPLGATGFAGEREPLIDALADADDAADALKLAARRALTHVLLVDVSEGEGGPRAELRALAVATGAVVWQASWSSERGGLGAAVEPWVRHLLTATGFSTGLPPPTRGPERRAVADLIWRGYAALEEDDEDGAEEALGEAVRRDPRAIRALLGMARLRAQQEEDEEAQAATDRALAVRPELVSSRVFAADAAADAARNRVRAVETLRDDARSARAVDPPAMEEARALDAEADAALDRAVEAFERTFALAEGPRPLLAAHAALAVERLRSGAPEVAASLLERALARLG